MKYILTTLILLLTSCSKDIVLPTIPNPPSSLPQLNNHRVELCMKGDSVYFESSEGELELLSNEELNESLDDFIKQTGGRAVVELKADKSLKVNFSFTALQKYTNYVLLRGKETSLYTSIKSFEDSPLTLQEYLDETRKHRTRRSTE